MEGRLHCPVCGEAYIPEEWFIVEPEHDAYDGYRLVCPNCGWTARGVVVPKHEMKIGSYIDETKE